MSAKQDRQGARTVTDLERRYNFGEQFAKILGIATDAQDSAQQAAEAVRNFNENLTPDQIFYLLTGGGADQGVYRENGKIYLNANYIKSGFISSDLIKAGVIRSLDYEVIEIDEIYPSATLYPYVRLYPNDGKDITKGMEIDFAAGVIRVGGDSGALSSYPVGSFFLSRVSTSPAELFGGVWEQIKDTFLLAAGDIYSAGTTGGEATHTLNINQIPIHDHFVYMGTGNENPAGVWGNVSVSPLTNTSKSVTSSTGGSQPHNNMPPYLAVYVWQRIA